MMNSPKFNIKINFWLIAMSIRVTFLHFSQSLAKHPTLALKVCPQLLGNGVIAGVLVIGGGGLTRRNLPIIEIMRVTLGRFAHADYLFYH